MPHFMQQAVLLARDVLGGTYPNPPVGAVLVKDDAVLAAGATMPCGQPHAEAVCLERAGERARGAELYVTLEPCAHQGRTPPCTDRIIAAGVRRVFIGCPDRNPLVNGKGIAALRAAGIEVQELPLPEETVAALYGPFFHKLSTGRPYVILKYAMTLDGKIACQSGHARWISGIASREYTHTLRREVHAILAGAETIRQDDPELTYRGGDADPRFQPQRIVLTREGRGLAERRVFHGPDPAWILHPAGHGRLPEGVPAFAFGDGLQGCLKRLGELGIVSLLVEGGQQVLEGFIEEDLYEELHVFVAPMLVGGERSPVHTVLAREMGQARVLAGSWRILGDDVHFRGVRCART